MMRMMKTDEYKHNEQGHHKQLSLLDNTCESPKANIPNNHQQ